MFKAMYLISISFQGVGPKRAIDLIRQHKSIEEIIKHIDTKVTVINTIVVCTATSLSVEISLWVLYAYNLNVFLSSVIVFSETSLSRGLAFQGKQGTT